MGKKQAEIKDVVATHRPKGPAFRVNSADLAERVAQQAGQIVELSAMLENVKAKVAELAGE